MVSSDILENYKKAVFRLILLDYDGTLVHHTSSPERAIPSHAVIRMLQQISALEKTDVILITGRQLEDINRLIAQVSIKVIPEHGAFADMDLDWKKEASEQIRKLTEGCQGAFIEEKQFCLTWHYRLADNGEFFANKVLQGISNLLDKHRLKVLNGNKVIELVPKDSGKGNTVKKLLNDIPYDFVLAIGNDVTDEEMFEELKNHKHAWTIKVGPGATVARYRMNSPTEVVRFLDQFIGEANRMQSS